MTTQEMLEQAYRSTTSCTKLLQHSADVLPELGSSLGPADFAARMLLSNSSIALALSELTLAVAALTGVLGTQYHVDPPNELR